MIDEFIVKDSKTGEILLICSEFSDAMDFAQLIRNASVYRNGRRIADVG